MEKRRAVRLQKSLEKRRAELLQLSLEKRRAVQVKILVEKRRRAVQMSAEAVAPKVLFRDVHGANQHFIAPRNVK